MNTQLIDHPQGGASLCINGVPANTLFNQAIILSIQNKNFLDFIERLG